MAAERLAWATSGRRRWISAVAVLAVVVATALVARSCWAEDASAEAFCQQVQRVPAIRTAEQLQGEGGQATLDDLRSALRSLRARSPSPVRGDVTTLVDVTGRLQEALRQQSDGTPAERDRATTELDASLAAFYQSSRRVVDYAQRTCGFDLDG
jgi:hypothetical protein